MDRIKILKSPKIYIATAVAIVIALLLFPMEGRFEYNYQKGKPWLYETLISPIDFPILKTETELLQERESKASQVIRYYNFDKNVASAQISGLMAELKGQNIDSDFASDVVDAFTEIYDRGIISSYEEEGASGKGVILVQKDKRAVQVPEREVYDVEYAVKTLRHMVVSEDRQEYADSLFNLYRFQDYIAPNLIFDQKKTDQIHLQAIDYISPTKGMVYTGQLIVSEGEIVTAEVAQLLDSYKQEYESSFGYSGSFYGLFFGHFIVILVIFSMLFATIYFTNISAFDNIKSYLYILLLFVLMFAITVLVGNRSQKLLYMVPYAVFAIYLVSFFKQKFAFPLYVLMLLPLFFLSPIGMELYFINLAAGVILLVSNKYFNKGWLQFINSCFIFISLLLVYVAFRLLNNGTLSAFDSKVVFYLGCNALFVVAAYPLVFLFEKIFSFVSTSRLFELSDTNSKLLLELANKAPGSFQHSLQVANMASAAARKIGGDVMLSRVGALYHDIGKIANPQCFIENQAPDVDFHHDLTPEESAHQIIRHVDDGVELARKYNLPEIVIDFIRTHHAKSLTGYFYNVYCNKGGDPDNKEPFMYHGEYPKTKEQVIVLMADAVEAASRSLKKYTEESISDLVEKIMAARLADDQLLEADISIKEINAVKEMFKEQLLQMYHARIAYPTIKKK